MHLDQKMMGVLAAAVLLACGGGGGSNDTPPPPPPPPPANAILINAGATADIADTDWKADQYFTGGSTYENANEMDLSKLSDPKPPVDIFHRERYGEMTYTIPGLTAGGAYTVTLYNEESYHADVGLRIFSVEINGTPVMTDYDLFADAGAQNTAVEKVFDATATEAGEIVIHFTPSVENPKICGIKVAPKA